MMGKRKETALDQFVRRREARELERFNTRKQAALIEESLESAWQAVCVRCDASSISSLGKLLSDLGGREAVQRVAERSQAYFKAVQNEPDVEWKYPGLTSGNPLDHATTMHRLAMVLITAIDGKSARTIKSHVDELSSFERCQWDLLRGEMVWFAHFPVEPIRTTGSKSQAISKAERWGKRAAELKKTDMSWSETFNQCKTEGYAGSQSALRGYAKPFMGPESPKTA